MTLKEALEVAVGNLEVPAHHEAIDTLRRWAPFIEAAVEHFAGERNYATVIDEYRAAVAAEGRP